jgi:hypothetical protein
LFFGYFDDGIVGEKIERSVLKCRHEKKVKINFAGVLNNATFAVPNKTGNKKKS